MNTPSQFLVVSRTNVYDNTFIQKFILQILTLSTDCVRAIIPHFIAFNYAGFIIH